MIQGQLFITTDMNLAMSSVNMFSIVCISCEVTNYPEFLNATNASVASILSPPYEVVSIDMEQGIQAFELPYINYLTQKEPATYVALILKALAKGINILLYLTPYEAEMSYSKVLINYLFQRYGIVTNILGPNMQVLPHNPALEYNIYESLLLSDLITSEEYIWGCRQCQMLPAVLNPYVLAKLFREIPFTNEQRTFTTEEVNAYYVSIMSQCAEIQQDLRIAMEEDRTGGC